MVKNVEQFVRDFLDEYEGLDEDCDGMAIIFRNKRQEIWSSHKDMSPYDMLQIMAELVVHGFAEMREMSTEIGNPH